MQNLIFSAHSKNIAVFSKVEQILKPEMKQSSILSKKFLLYHAKEWL